jgi:hypothetical protein
MYTLYTDKSEDFKCNIGVEGATTVLAMGIWYIHNTTFRTLKEKIPQF